MEKPKLHIFLKRQPSNECNFNPKNRAAVLRASHKRKKTKMQNPNRTAMQMIPNILTKEKFYSPRT
jgi:hypothetical protein